jgi:hypothetical protein
MGIRPRVELHIEELVLEGFPLGDRYRIGEALEAELTRLLEERGVPGSFISGKEIDGIHGGSFDVVLGCGADRIGSQVAKAVYGGLRRG